MRVSEAAASRRSTLADERCLQEALSSHQQRRQHKSHLPESPAAARRRRGAGLQEGARDDGEGGALRERDAGSGTGRERRLRRER